MTYFSTNQIPVANHVTFSCRDSLVVAIGDTLTAIFAGFVIFAIIGYMAKEIGVPIEEVATQGQCFGRFFLSFPKMQSKICFDLVVKSKFSDV